MAEVTRKIRFFSDYEVKDHRAGTREAEVYKANATKTMSEASAAHFVSRGLAEYVSAK